MMDDYNHFYCGISELVSQLSSLVDEQLPYYEVFTNKVANGIVSDIHTIERNLDSMLPLCFDDRVLVLYKRILQTLILTKRNPYTVLCYVDAYYDMYGDGGGIE